MLRPSLGSPVHRPFPPLQSPGSQTGAHEGMSREGVGQRESTGCQGWDCSAIHCQPSEPVLVLRTAQVFSRQTLITVPAASALNSVCQSYCVSIGRVQAPAFPQLLCSHTAIVGSLSRDLAHGYSAIQVFSLLPSYTPLGTQRLSSLTGRCGERQGAVQVTPILNAVSVATWPS